jgi:branched-chain amino acid aminotransferase
MSEFVLILRQGNQAELVEEATATFPISDRAFMYGDGLFETIRVLGRRAPFLFEHLDRLQLSAARLLFPPLPWEIDEIAAACKRLMQANEIRDGYLKLTLSRGIGARGYEAPERPEPVLIVQGKSWAPPPAVYVQGYRATVASFRVSPESPTAHVKSLSALEKVLARTEARQKGCDEALLLNTDNFVTEGAATNLFVVHARSIQTPHPSCGVLPGIGRRLVLQATRNLDYRCHEGFLTLDDLRTADEVFVTNSLILAVAVTELDGQPIGRHAGPGPVTRAMYREVLAITSQGAI